MRGSAKQIRTTGVSWREVNGEVIALDLESSSYFTTNASGSLMWNALVGGATERDLAELLCQRFGIARSSAMADARAFVSVLEEHGLVEDLP